LAPALCNLAEVTTALRGGAVLVMPTDTLPGLHGRADRPEVSARIARIKGRSLDKPLLVLAGSLDQARDLTSAWPDEVAAYADRCWPGPHTLILPARTDLPVIVGSDDTVAVRVPAVSLLRAVIIAVGYPLVSTSVNRADEPPQTDLDGAVRLFAAEVDGWWCPDQKTWGDDRTAGADGHSSGHLGGGPSSLIDLCGWPPRLLRPGRATPPPW